jgi:hypothetical protein
MKDIKDCEMCEKDKGNENVIQFYMENIKKEGKQVDLKDLYEQYEIKCESVEDKGWVWVFSNKTSNTIYLDKNSLTLDGYKELYINSNLIITNNTYMVMSLRDNKNRIHVNGCFELKGTMELILEENPRSKRNGNIYQTSDNKTYIKEYYLVNYDCVDIFQMENRNQITMLPVYSQSECDDMTYVVQITKTDIMLNVEIKHRKGVCDEIKKVKYTTAVALIISLSIFSILLVCCITKCVKQSTINKKIQYNMILNHIDDDIDVEMMETKKQEFIQMIKKK